MHIYTRQTCPEETQPFPVHSLVQAERKLSVLHRSRIDIIASILHTAEKGVKKTHIMYACNLSFRQLHVYLDFLLERKLLRSVPARKGERGDSIMYETTAKGRDFVQAYRSIRALLSS